MSGDGGRPPLIERLHCYSGGNVCSPNEVQHDYFSGTPTAQELGEVGIELKENDEREHYSRSRIKCVRRDSRKGWPSICVDCEGVEGVIEIRRKDGRRR